MSVIVGFQRALYALTRAADAGRTPFSVPGLSIELARAVTRGEFVQGRRADTIIMNAFDRRVLTLHGFWRSFAAYTTDAELDRIGTLYRSGQPVTTTEELYREVVNADGRGYNPGDAALTYARACHAVSPRSGRGLLALVGAELGHEQPRRYYNYNPGGIGILGRDVVTGGERWCFLARTGAVWFSQPGRSFGTRAAGLHSCLATGRHIAGLVSLSQDAISGSRITQDEALRFFRKWTGSRDGTGGANQWANLTRIVQRADLWSP